MTSQLEKTFGLTPMPKKQLVSDEKLNDIVDNYGIKKHTEEMDDIYDQAVTAHKDMLDLGFNVDPKNAGSILTPAAKMLEIALNASRSKVEQKLRMRKLEIEREKLEIQKRTEPDAVIQEDGGIMTTRNALFDEIEREENNDIS